MVYTPSSTPIHRHTLVGLMKAYLRRNQITGIDVYEDALACTQCDVKQTFDPDAGLDPVDQFIKEHKHSD